MKIKELVEAAGVELFHILWFLQLADSKKETKYSKFYFAVVIVRVSYTENRANFAEMSSATREFLHSICWFCGRSFIFRSTEETRSFHNTGSHDCSHLSIILKYAQKDEGR